MRSRPCNPFAEQHIGLIRCHVCVLCRTINLIGEALTLALDALVDRDRHNGSHRMTVTVENDGVALSDDIVDDIVKMLPSRLDVNGLRHVRTPARNGACL